MASRDVATARRISKGPRGEAGARALAVELRRFGSFRLEHSSEPKARRTAEVVAGELGLGPHERHGFEEIDRAPLPILSRAEHAAHNVRLFAEPARAVVGDESAERALARFEHALGAALSEQPAREPLVVVTHGTVMALLVAAHNPIAAVELWQRLECPSFVVLHAEGYRLSEVRDAIASDAAH
ncbi:MAG TPA: histidine phosphatase family protein [Polyangiaceae bacterium]|nr:histidine phosphatase family protein [Polyangiaceae bacterium]